MKQKISDEQKILKIISNHLGIRLEELTPDADLREDLNAQNLEISDLLMKLEKELQMQLSTEESRKIKKVIDILDLFQSV